MSCHASATTNHGDRIGEAPLPYRPIQTSRGSTKRYLRQLLEAARGSVRALLPTPPPPHANGPIQGMVVASRQVAPQAEDRLVSMLTASYAAAKAHQLKLSGPYAPGAYWKILIEKEWRRFQMSLDRHDQSAMATFLRNFFRTEALSGFWGDTQMFGEFASLDGEASIRRADLMRRQFEVWRAELPNAPIGELSAPPIGNPWGYVVEGNLLYEPVCEYHYQADYFARLLSGIERPVIVEIGGGFGGLAYQIMKRIPGARYIGFDLPESTLLQSYYLSCAFPEARMLIYGAGMETITANAVVDFDIAVLPNFMIPKLAAGVADLVVNVRSLAEMPSETIAEYLTQVGRIGRLFFFHENIYKRRDDGLHGIPSSEFPTVTDFVQVASSESRWPRYDRTSAYPCRENLLIRRGAIRR